MQYALIEMSGPASKPEEFVEIEATELELREDLAGSLLSCCPIRFPYFGDN